MENTKTVKALKKQLMAAIAMVLVAAIALGSSTYAWFVSNNTVKATTTTISAQSNAPFLKIDKEALSASSTTAATRASEDSVALYPAEVVKNTDDNAPLFQSAYASAKDKSTELSGTRFDVGTAEVASTADETTGSMYALKQSFVIGTTDDRAGSFKNLKVAKVELAGATEGTLLGDALSVLVVCGENWAVYKKSEDGTVLTEYYDSKSAEGNNTNGILADTIAAAGSVNVDCYIFYDGSEKNVHTDNLSANKLTALGATITFTATPVSTNGKDATGDNFVQ